MKVKYGFCVFFSADGADGGSGGGTPPVDDIAGLKSALEKERATAKQLKAEMAELRGMANKGQGTVEELETLKKRLAEYDLRETRSLALRDAIAKATADGKFAVDGTKAAKFAERIATNPEKLKEDIQEIVENLKLPVTEQKGPTPPTPPKNPIPGQPANGGQGSTTSLSPGEWAQLYRTDPEAYKAMQEARRKDAKFKIK